ncbi:hypothetical protein JL15_24710 [Mycolicibacterium phlei DSM 43071]|nr:hypothetical protein JL15_24710 [Mycolicibacterium phlei DSM 43071]
MATATTAAPTTTGRGCHTGAGSFGSRRPRTGTNASSASTGSSASPPNSPARYGRFSGNVSVTVPSVPGGSSQPCCQPLTVIGVNSVPSPACATQPGLMLSGTTSTRDVAAASTVTSRRSGPHVPVRAGSVGAGVISPASGPTSCAPSTTNVSPGLITSSC